MKQLRELQQSMQRSLLPSLDSQKGLSTDNLLAEIKEHHPLMNAERLQIYQDSVHVLLVRALKITYPVCEKLVGEDFFYAMAEQYLQIKSAIPIDLSNYGDAFPDFVKKFPPAQVLAYLPEVLLLEQAWYRAFLGPEVTVLDLASLSHMVENGEEVYFNLHPGSSLLAAEYPVDRIWEVNQDDYPHEPIVDLDEGGVKLIVSRRGKNVLLERLTAAQWFILSCCEQGLALHAISEQALQQTLVIDVDVELAELVRRRWLLLGDGSKPRHPGI